VQTKARDAAVKLKETLDDGRSRRQMAQDAYDQTKKGYTVLFKRLPR